MQVGRADLDEPHAELAREEAGERDLELRVGEEEDALARELCALRGERTARALACRRGDRVEVCVVDAEGFAAAAQPARRAFGAEREGRGEPLRAALLERARRVGEEGLGEQEARAGTDRRQLAARRGGKKCTGPMPRSANRRANWSSTTSASAPDHEQRPAQSAGAAGRLGTSAARQASSPCVKVVSMPLPE